MIDYFNIAGRYIQSYPVPANLDGWRPATAADYESLLVPADWPSAIAARRYAAEVAGISVAGMSIATDDRSKTLIAGAALAAMRNPEYVLNWKTPSGFVHLIAIQVLAVADSVHAHVQACFDREAELLAELESGTFTEAMLDQGWPNESVPEPAAG